MRITKRLRKAELCAGNYFVISQAYFYTSKISFSKNRTMSYIKSDIAVFLSADYSTSHEKHACVFYLIGARKYVYTTVDAMFKNTIYK